MKKKNEPQDSDRRSRVLKKMALDEQQAGGTGRDYEDFDDPLEDDELRIDHFDFDDADVEHFRQESRRKEQAREQGSRGQEKSARQGGRVQKKNLEPEQTTRKSGKTTFFNTIAWRKARDEEAERDRIREAYIRRQRAIAAEKRKTNKEIMRVTYVMIAIFIGMIGYFIYFNVTQSEEIVNNPYNSRLAKLSEDILRGEIRSADGDVLAQSVVDEEGNVTRVYPYGADFAHVVGTSEINKSGIELTADYELVSCDISPVKQIFNELREDKNEGNTIVTTLDTSLQVLAREELGDMQGAIVAIEPSTGKVLAMVSTPDYDPNTLEENYQSILEDETSSVLLNQATQGLFTPGSIFKIVTTLAYIRCGYDMDSYEYYCDGSIDLMSDDGDSYLKCYDGESHGYVNLEESFAESCNSSYANLGLSISVSMMQETAEDLLFNTDLPTGFTTSRSAFSLSQEDTEWTIGATAIGQGNTSVSPMHMAMIAAAIANDGELMQPYVIDHILNADESLIKQYAPESYGQLMTASEAETMTQLMEEVVNNGTAYRLADRSYQAAGKTGTAEVAGSGNNAWFVGFAPADDPQIAVCILVEDAGTASSTAVPIAVDLFDSYLSDY